MDNRKIEKLGSILFQSLNITHQDSHLAKDLGSPRNCSGSNEPH